jgi:light-regulated signal transduction histidine kinase (bacteriophytochrome)
MDVTKNRNRTLFSWIFAASLAALCVSLGALQYRWIGEVSRADRQRLRESLQDNLRRLSQDFDAEIATATSALLPGTSNTEGTPQAYADRFLRWKSTGGHTSLFLRVGIAVPVVEIRVKDRGPGIPKTELESVFNPFYRGRRAVEDQIHGTGLGLSLVKRIGEAHDGTVSVASEPGKGTEFVVRLPAAPAELVNEFADLAHRG